MHIQCCFILYRRVLDTVIGNPIIRIHVETNLEISDDQKKAMQKCFAEQFGVDVDEIVTI